MLERDYQKHVKLRLKQEFPGCIIQKQDEHQKQGVPDLLILHGKKWAALEVKRSEDSPHRPNQDYWVEHMNGLSYASFIFPENEEQVFKELKEVLV